MGGADRFVAHLDELFALEADDGEVQPRRGHRRPDRPVRPRQRAEPAHRLPLHLRRPAVAHPGARPPDRRPRSSTTPPRASAATRTAARCRPGTCSARSASTRWRRAATEYVIGAPQVARAEIDLGGGQRLTVAAEGLSADNLYIQSVTPRRRALEQGLPAPRGPRPRRRPDLRHGPRAEPRLGQLARRRPLLDEPGALTQPFAPRGAAPAAMEHLFTDTLKCQRNMEIPHSIVKCRFLHSHRLQTQEDRRCDDSTDSWS